jgi:hypothetical protein
MFPRLSLRGNWSSTRSWSHCSTTTDQRTGAVLTRSGTRLEQGWRLAFVNGFVLAGPFQRIYALDTDGDARLFGPSAFAARQAFLRRNPRIRREAWGPFQQVAMALLEVLCSLLALLATLVTLPIFVVLWVVWAVVAGFWLLALVIARWALTLVLRRPL